MKTSTAYHFFEFWAFNAISCRIRFYFHTCLNKRVADDFSADETRFRCTEFVPISLNCWYNMQLIWCTHFKNKITAYSRKYLVHSQNYKQQNGMNTYPIYYLHIERYQARVLEFRRSNCNMADIYEVILLCWKRNVKSLVPVRIQRQEKTWGICLTWHKWTRQR